MMSIDLAPIARRSAVPRSPEAREPSYRGFESTDSLERNLARMTPSYRPWKIVLVTYWHDAFLFNLAPHRSHSLEKGGICCDKEEKILQVTGGEVDDAPFHGRKGLERVSLGWLTARGIDANGDPRRRNFPGIGRAANRYLPRPPILLPRGGYRQGADNSPRGPYPRERRASTLSDEAKVLKRGTGAEATWVAIPSCVPIEDT